MEEARENVLLVYTNFVDSFVDSNIHFLTLKVVCGKFD